MQPARNQPARDARAVPLTRLSYADGSSVQHGEISGGERVLLTATPWPGSSSNATRSARAWCSFGGSLTPLRIVSLEAASRAATISCFVPRLTASIRTAADGAALAVSLSLVFDPEAGPLPTSLTYVYRPSAVFVPTALILVGVLVALALLRLYATGVRALRARGFISYRRIHWAEMWHAPPDEGVELRAPVDTGMPPPSLAR